MNLEWNVYYHDFNKRSIERFNVFRHGRFLEDVKNDLKNCKTMEEFAENLLRHLRYYYWGKAEWEVVITSWVPHITVSELDRINAERERTLKEYDREPYSLYINPDVGAKVDIYEQIMLNWGIFVDYIWSHRK